MAHGTALKASRGLTSGGLWYTDDRVDRLASKVSNKAGSRLLLVSAMTGFSANTTSLAASGSVDNRRLQVKSTDTLLLVGPFHCETEAKNSFEACQLTAALSKCKM